MSVAFAKRSTGEVKKFASEALQCVDEELALQHAFASEHIRSALFGNAIVNHGGTSISPVHSTRLLTTARKNLNLLWPGVGNVRGATATGDVAQHVLDHMATLGEIHDIGGGLWISTPLRLIGEDINKPFLIVGAAPSSVIKDLAGASPICAGAGRFIVLPPSHHQRLASHIVSMNEWLGGSESIGSWTQRLLKNFERRIVSSSEIDADHLEIYAPDLFKAQGKLGRWMSIRKTSTPVSGLRLCRPLAKYAQEWDRPYYLAFFNSRSGETRAAGSIRIPYDLTLRLRFGLDELLAAKRTVIVNLYADFCEIELPYWLPKPEDRVLALGWSIPSKPERIRIHALALPFLNHIFSRLSILPLTRRGA
jgi:hypothetical protein